MGRKQTDPATQAKMVEMYQSGRTLAESAAAFGLTTKAARNALMRAGVERREGGLERGTPFRDWTDRRFGRLLAVSPSPDNPIRKMGSPFKWVCRCDCGTTVVVAGGKLGNGHTRSCGCLRSEVNAERMTIHGRSNTAEYVAWMAMKQRCFDRNSNSWPDYGGRGIVPCRGMAESFQVFLDVLGFKPSPSHSVDRINNNKGYFCGQCDECILSCSVLNVRWATQSEQSKNTRVSISVTFNGRTLPLMDWASELDMPYALLHQRLTHGWSVQKAFTTPAKSKKRRPRSEESRMRNVWRSMIARCENPNVREFKWYGAKGVKVCERWLNSFDEFFADMGPRPSPDYSLDRFPDCTGNYEPGNVRWATRKEQSNNQSSRGKATRIIARHTTE